MEYLLISIRPLWCNEISDGSKRVELRRMIPKWALEKVLKLKKVKCLIYCTKAKPLIPYVLGDNLGPNDYINGKVIGEFDFEDYESVVWDMTNRNFRTWALNPLELEDASVVTQEQMLEYFGEEGEGHAIYISNLKLFDEPRKLSFYGVKRAPQNMMKINFKE